MNILFQHIGHLILAALLLIPLALHASGHMPTTLRQVRRALGIPSNVRLNAGKTRLNVGPVVITGKGAAAASHRKLLLHSRLNAADIATLMPMEPEYHGNHAHGVVTRINADLLTEGTYRESLTNFAVGFPGVDFARDLEVLAPGVQVANRFDYKAFDNAEAFYSEVSDDLRAPRGDFKEVEFTCEEVTAKTANRGLQVVVDRDQVRNNPNWEQQYTQMLLTRLRLNQLRRAIALLSAGSTNAAKTWDTSDGKNPDGDIRTELKTAHTAAGVRPNRVAYGPTAWDLRVSSHEAQDNAGGHAAAQRDEKALARYLNLEEVLICQARYSTSASAKSEALSNLVLMFNALKGATVEDPSNIKRFWSPCDNGMELMVHRYDIGAKKMALAVELYELLKLTSTLGLRKGTIS